MLSVGVLSVVAPLTNLFIHLETNLMKTFGSKCTYYLLFFISSLEKIVFNETFKKYSQKCLTKFVPIFIGLALGGSTNVAYI
jgi:hypothetical protein